MTKERAKYILKNCLWGGSLKYAFYGKYGASTKWHIYEDGITMEEDNTIRAVWDKMDGNSTYSSALRKIAKKGV